MTGYVHAAHPVVRFIRILTHTPSAGPNRPARSAGAHGASCSGVGNHRGGENHRASGSGELALLTAEACHANAASPAQDAAYRKLRALLVLTPHDRTVGSSLPTKPDRRMGMVRTRCP